MHCAQGLTFNSSFVTIFQHSQPLSSLLSVTSGWMCTETFFILSSKEFLISVTSSQQSLSLLEINFLAPHLHIFQDEIPISCYSHFTGCLGNTINYWKRERKKDWKEGKREGGKDGRKEGREGGRKKNWFLHNWYVLFPYSSYGNWNGNSLPSPYLLCRLFFAESDHQEGTNDSECCLLIPRT